MAAVGTSPPQPGEGADQRDMAADAHGRDRLRQRARAAELDDMIDAAPVGQAPHRIAPVGLRPVVDGVVGTQRAARSSFSSDDEVTITVAPIALANWSAKIETPPVPSTSTMSPALSLPSATSARQAVSPAVVSVAASTVAAASRRPGEPARRPHDDLARVAVDPVARHGGEIAQLGRAVLPGRKEAGHDVVAGRELGHPVAHRLDHTGAVGHRDAAARASGPRRSPRDSRGS